MVRNFLKYGILLGGFISSAMCDVKSYMAMEGRIRDLLNARIQTNTSLSNEDMEWIYSQVKNCGDTYVTDVTSIYWGYLIGSGEYDTGTEEQRNEVDKLQIYLTHKYAVDHGLIAE